MTQVSQLPAMHALVKMVSHLPSVVSVEFLRIGIPPSVELRPGASPALRDYAKIARTAKSAGDSFTETLVTVAQDHGDTEAALAVIGFHQPLSDAHDRITLRRPELTFERVSQLATQVAPGEMLVVTSRVQTTSGLAHIPLLDMKLASSDTNDPVASAVARHLGGGYLINSGSSYHLYGNRLLTDAEFREWLLRAQLFSRCVDTRWVTHQLLEGRAALRLSLGGSRSALPMLVARV